jgi:IS30 family transposase
LTLVARINTEQTGILCAANINHVKPYQSDPRTITYDNGKGLEHHEEDDHRPKADCYFVNSYSHGKENLMKTTAA